MSVNASIRQFIGGISESDVNRLISSVANEFFISESNSLVERLSKYQLTEETLQSLLESKPISLSKSESLPYHVEAVIRLKEASTGFDLPFIGRIVPATRADISDGYRSKTVKVLSIIQDSIKLEESVDVPAGSTVVLRSDSKVHDTVYTHCRGCGHLKRVSVFPQGLGVCQSCYKDVRTKQQKVLGYIEGELEAESFFTLKHRKPVIIPHRKAHIVKVENLGDKPTFHVEHEGQTLLMRQGHSTFVELISPKRYSIAEAAERGVTPSGVDEEGIPLYQIEGEDYVMVHPRHIQGLQKRSSPENLRIKRNANPEYFEGKYLELETRGDPALEHMVRIFNVSRSLKYVNDAPLTPEGVNEVYSIFTRHGGEKEMSRTVASMLSRKVCRMAEKLIIENVELTEEWVSKLVTMQSAVSAFERMSK